MAVTREETCWGHVMAFDVGGTSILRHPDGSPVILTNSYTGKKVVLHYADDKPITLVSRCRIRTRDGYCGNNGIFSLRCKYNV